MEELSKSDVEKLKKENQLYKDFISQLPYSFVYQQPGMDYQLRKMGCQVTWTDAAIIGEGRDLIQDPFEMIERQLSIILDDVPHHVVFIDPHGMITLCNRQAARDLGVKQCSVIGHHIRDLLRIPDQKIMTLRTLESKEEIHNLEVLDRNYGILNTRIIYNHDGSIKRVIGFMEFLNHLKDAEKQAHAGRIAAGIAHEIRNPLTTVRGYLQFLEDQVSPEISKLFRMLLIPEIDRANNIISDFLRLAKPPKEYKRECFGVGEFFTEYLANFLNGGAFLDNGRIYIELTPESLSYSIEGNKDELVQVFINLYRNSLEASEDKPLIIKLKVMERDGWLSILFSDNGSGIDPSILAHIFDPFFTTKGAGTGLGLSLSKKIIENHEGIINVDSDNNGTIFTILLPCRRDN